MTDLSNLKVPAREPNAAKIAGTGMYLPEEKITNEELGQKMNYDVEEYLAEKGIKVRFKAGPDESTSDLAAKASKTALKDAGIEAEEIDLIILATDTPDYVTPPTSAILQYKLGAVNAGSFDINAACTDETLGLAIGSQYIALDPEIENVLVAGAYGMTRWLDWDDYTNSASKVLGMLFSDGGGAVVLSQTEKPGYLASNTLTEGKFWDAYGIYMGTANPPNPEMIEKKQNYLRFHENEHHVPPDFNESRWPDLVKDTMEKVDAEISDIDSILFNQIDKSTIKETMRRMDLGQSKTHLVMDKFGYAGSASILMALDDALEEGKIDSGDIVAFCTSGAGFVMSVSLFKWI
ncbi:MAG: 3-oxoacyl-ACP synthase III family protein [Candidatus Bipolaricaulia bacterium]